MFGCRGKIFLFFSFRGQHIGYFWTPNDEQCLALATGYRDDPAFRKTYDAIHPDLAAFMADAVKVYVEARKKK